MNENQNQPPLSNMKAESPTDQQNPEALLIDWLKSDLNLILGPAIQPPSTDLLNDIVTVVKTPLDLAPGVQSGQIGAVLSQFCGGCGNLLPKFIDICPFCKTSTL